MLPNRSVITPGSLQTRTALLRTRSGVLSGVKSDLERKGQVSRFPQKCSTIETHGGRTSATLVKLAIDQLY